MDGQRFDEMAKDMARGMNRRRMLRGMGGVIAAAVALRTHGIGAQQAKQALCHFTGSADNPWQVITVAEPAWDTHFAHGDHVYVDCCDDGACAGFDTCGGGGTKGKCGCTAKTVCADGDIGNVEDGCGGWLECGCRSYILAGRFGKTSTFSADGEFKIYINDELIADASGTINPLPLNATVGDVLRFEAINTVNGCQNVSLVNLYCANSMMYQTATWGSSDPSCTGSPSTIPYFTDSKKIVI
jgi:hypothetical protein